MSRDIVAIGRNGRRYTIEELERAIEGAARGEPAAVETLRQVELDQAGA